MLERAFGDNPLKVAVRQLLFKKNHGGHRLTAKTLGCGPNNLGSTPSGYPNNKKSN